MLGNNKKNIGFNNSIYNASGGQSIDPSALAFILAAGITNPTQQAAINRLVKNYKGIGNINTSVDLWSGSNAIYPLVGGSASSHKFNLKDPRDLNAAFRLGFFGGITQNANGITGNGVNGFVSTNLKPLSNLSTISGRVGLYITTNVNENRYDAGCVLGVNEVSVYSRSGGGLIISSYGFSASFGAIANDDARGFLITNRNSATNTTTFKNGVKVLDFAQAAGVPDINIYFCATNNAGTPSLFSTKTFAFGVIGQGISDANSLIEYNIIQQFQTDLSRQV
jgi:hypothetical protein